jgi:hypothetical protein
MELKAGYKPTEIGVIPEEKNTFSCTCIQNRSQKPPFLVYVSSLNKSEAFSLIGLKLIFREVQQ